MTTEIAIAIAEFAKKIPLEILDQDARVVSLKARLDAARERYQKAVAERDERLQIIARARERIAELDSRIYAECAHYAALLPQYVRDEVPGELVTEHFLGQQALELQRRALEDGVVDLERQDTPNYIAGLSDKVAELELELDDRRALVAVELSQEQES